MKYCSDCGAEIQNDAKFCGVCGTKVEADNQDPFATPQAQTTTQDPFATNNTQEAHNTNYTTQQNNKQESKTYAILSLIFGALGGWLGLLFGILGLSQYKNQSNRTMCILGIVFWAIWFVLTLFV